MVRISDRAPDFEEDAFRDGEIEKLKLNDFKGRWLILFFYPGDFTFVCPTELGELADRHEELKKLDAEVVSVSVDTAFVHKAWHDHSEMIAKIRFPMLADPARRVCKAYDTLIDNEGISLRATFIIDPHGTVKAYEFHHNDIGRNIDELLRKLEAAQYVSTHKGQVCPVNWIPGAKTLKPGLDLVGKI
jgi:NADH-dependent peroxiredoxin subunit C